MELDGLLFFFLVIAIGYFAARVGLLPDNTADVLPSLLINLCYPALILDTFSGIQLQELLTTGFPVVAATLCITLSMYFLTGFLYRKLPQKRIATLRFISGIGNVTYVAVPLLSLFLSKELMFVVIIHGAVQDFLIWSLYQQMFLRSSAASRRDLWLRLATSPCLIAAVVGVLLVVFAIPLPSFLQMTISRLNGMTAPVAQLFLGLLICRHGLFSWRTDKMSICYALGKVFLFSGVLFLILVCFFPLSQALVLAIAFASPAPLTSVVWAKEYDGDVPFAVDCVICSTLIFLIAMSLLLLCLSRFSLI